jgi:hypothetical protein
MQGVSMRGMSMAAWLSKGSGGRRIAEPMNPIN